MKTLKEGSARRDRDLTRPKGAPEGRPEEWQVTVGHAPPATPPPALNLSTTPMGHTPVINFSILLGDVLLAHQTHTYSGKALRLYLSRTVPFWRWRILTLNNYAPFCVWFLNFRTKIVKLQPDIMISSRCWKCFRSRAIQTFSAKRCWEYKRHGFLACVQIVQLYSFLCRGTIT